MSKRLLFQTFFFSAILAFTCSKSAFSSDSRWELLSADKVDDVIGMEKAGDLGSREGEIPPVPLFPPPIVTNKIDILCVIMRNIDADYYDAEGNLQHETSSMYNFDVSMIELQFQKFADTVYHYSGGWLEITTDVLIIDEPITEISGNGSSGYHVNADDMAWAYEDYIDFGRYDTVMLYWKPIEIPTGGIWGLAWWYYQGTTPEGEAWGAEIQPTQGAAYINCFYYSSLSYMHWELNLHEWLHHLNALMYYKAGFPDEMVPDSHYDDDPDWDPEGHSSMDYYVHILVDHMTPLLYASAEVIDMSDAPYYRDWLVLGPFENEGDSGLTVDFIGEETILPREGMESGGFTWEALNSSGDYIDFIEHWGFQDQKVAYVHTYVRSPSARPARIWTGSNDGIRIWLNGNLVRDTHVHRRARADAEETTVLFLKGWNRLLIKVEDVAGYDWGFYCRVFGFFGGVLEGFQRRLDPPPLHYFEADQAP
ncbi:MAG: hypothetical protein ACE5OP_09040 [Candidatus Glassbacteria bacterium]